MATCNLCGVERDVPAVGPHHCDPVKVRNLALEDAATLVEYLRRTEGAGLDASYFARRIRERAIRRFT